MAELRFLVGEELSGDWDNHIAILDLFERREDAIDRRRQIIRLRASPTGPWPRPESETAASVHVWELVE